MKISKKNLTTLMKKWSIKDPGAFRDFVANRVLENQEIRDEIVKTVIPKLFMKKTIQPVTDELMEYLEDDNDIVVADTKPKTKSNYIGIEIECFSHMERLEVQMLAMKMGMSDWLDIGEDGSIEPDDYEEPYELRVLIREKELKKKLKQLNNFLKAGKFQVNASCGLHVHLDMRHRNMPKMYDRLVKFQDLLFCMVDEDRRNNEYCQRVNTWNERHKYVAINKLPYETKKTLEVRLHQGTTDTNLIGNWINLLLRILNKTDAPSSMKNKGDIMQWLIKNPKLKSYVKDTFKQFDRTVNGW